MNEQGIVYILECSDGTFYTGSTPHLEKRINEHNRLKSGARYTKARRPVVLRYYETLETVSLARTREAVIKRMSRKEKIELMNHV